MKIVVLLVVVLVVIFFIGAFSIWEFVGMVMVALACFVIDDVFLSFIIVILLDFVGFAG